jgi:endonuclease G
MAKRAKKKSSKPAKSRAPAGPSMESLQRFVRTEGATYLAQPNINSVGIGYKNAHEGDTSERVCVQFTVDSKAQPEQLESLRTRMIPPQVIVDGHVVPTDVIERRFAPSYLVYPELEALKSQRKERQEVLRPGLSVSHPSGTAGTIGALVYDRETGSPMILSNWHVLNTPSGRIGDEIVQPGPADDNRVTLNGAGHLRRSFRGPAGDCAVASIEGRAADPKPVDVNAVPRRLGKAELGDVVVKSGRTTDVTYGVVTRIEVQTKIHYGDEVCTIGGFEIGVWSKRKPKGGEVSMGGDSGSAWLAVDVKAKKTPTTDVMLGLHFAGNAEGEKREYALACNAHSVFEKLAITLSKPGTPKTEAAALEKAERTFGGSGYDATFLGQTLALPAPSESIKKDVVGAGSKNVADFTHFSLAIRRSRRLAAFVAWNIDGKHAVTVADKKIAWGSDSRIGGAADDFQTGSPLYDGTLFDKGHIAKREDLCWGTPAQAKRANDDSMCYANCSPQHEKFNRLAPALWKSLEDEIFRQVKVQMMRLSLLGGPIFKSTDRAFKPSGAPEGFAAVKIPAEFYKVVAYVDDGDGKIKCHAFKLSQATLIAGKLEAAAPESLDLVKFNMYQLTVARLETLTGLRMPSFRSIDTLLQGAHPEALEAVEVHQHVPIESFADIVR